MKKLLITITIISIIGTLLSGCAGGTEPASQKKNIEVNNIIREEIEPEVKVVEKELYNQNGIIINYLGLQKGILGTEIKISVENTTDEAVEIQAVDCSINGYMTFLLSSTKVLPHKKAIDKISLIDENVQFAPNEIETMDLQFNIVNPETYETLLRTGLTTIVQ